MLPYGNNMATKIWVNLVSGNGLIPDGNKPLPESILTYHQWGSLALTNFTGINILILKTSLENTLSPKINFTQVLITRSLDHVSPWYLLQNMSKCCIAEITTTYPKGLQRVNSFPPGQNDHHFADNIFKDIFMNEKLCILIQISPKFVPKGPIDNKSVLV